MSTEIDYVILESEYNVLMALMNYYEKEYVMECYYMEAGLNSTVQKAGSAVAQGASNVGQKIDQGFNNAIQKGNTAVDKFGQKIDNAANNSNGNFTQNIANKIENGINKLLGWCKKASNFIILNTNKVPPETVVQTIPQTPQLKQKAVDFAQLSQQTAQVLNQPESPQADQQIAQLTKRIEALEAEVKNLKIKQTLADKKQQAQNQPQPIQQQQKLPPLKFNRPNTQQPQPQPVQQQQQLPPLKFNRPNAQQPGGGTTIKVGEIKQAAQQMQQNLDMVEKNFNQALKSANQAATNAQQQVNQPAAPKPQSKLGSLKQNLMSKFAKAGALLLDGFVDLAKDTWYGGMHETSVNIGDIAGWQQSNPKDFKLCDYDPSTQTIVKTDNPSAAYILDKSGLVYPHVGAGISNDYNDQFDEYQIGQLDPNVFDLSEAIIENGTIRRFSQVLPARINLKHIVTTKGKIKSFKPSYED
jgi:hypothetical protein